MTETTLAFLSQETAPDDITPEPEPAEAAPVEPVADAQGEPAAPPAAPADEARQIPISALLDEREKRQAKEREAEELRRKIAEYEAKSQQQPPPDVFTDPDKRLAYEQAQMQSAIMGVKMQQSRFLAERDFSPDEVKAAVEWFNDYPELSHRMLNHASPFHAAVETYRKFRAAEKVGPDPDAWINTEVERRLAERLATQPVQKPATPPRSLASAPAASGAEPKGAGFSALFGG